MSRVILDVMSEGVSLSTEEGFIVYANPAEERLFGYPAGAMVGLHVSEQNAYPAEENAAIVEEVMAHLRKHGEWRGEWVNKRRDGSAFLTQTRITAVDWRGRRHWLCVRSALGDAAASEAWRSALRLDLAAEAAAIGVWDWDLLTDSFHYSPRAKAIYGFPQDRQPTYEEIRAATDPRDRDRMQAILAGALDPQRRLREKYEYRIARPDGGRRWLEASGFAVFETVDGVERPVRYVGTIQDVTEEKEEEERARAAAGRLKLAMEAARMAVWEVDFVDGGVVTSPELNRIFGFPPDAHPTMEEFRSRYAEDDQTALEDNWRIAAERGERFVETLSRLTLPDRSLRWIQTRAELSYEEGRPVRAIGVTMDVTDRKRNEATLQAIIASELVGLAVYDVNNDAVTLINDEFLRLTGHTREDFDAGRWNWRELTPPEHLVRDERAIAQARARGWFDPYEKEYRRPDGRRVMVRMTSAQLPGHPNTIIVAAEDFTEEARAAAAERRALERLRLATETGRLGSFDYDVATGRVEWDAAQLAIFGLERAPGSLEEIFALTHEGDRERLSALYAEALASGESYATHFRVRRPDGEIRWCMGSTAVERNEAGAATRVYGYTFDLSDQRRLEDDLAEREQLLSTLLEAAELFVGVCELTEDGYQYLLANRRTRAYHSIPAHARFPLAATATPLSKDEIAAWRATMEEIADSGEPRTMEYAFSRGGEQTGWYIGTYSPMPPGPNGAKRLSFVVIDVTARKEAEQRQALLMREVDHRAKNALAVVQAVVQLTREAEPKAFKSAVIGRVGAIARAHGLLAADRWTGVALRRLLEEELDAYRTDDADRIRLSGPDHALAATHAQSIAIVLHELATNAVKYGALAHPKGRLAICWSASPSGELRLEWSEFSPEFAPPPSRLERGFGLQLLEQTITRQLKGEWSMCWTRDGLAFSLTIPPQGSVSAAPTLLSAQGGPNAIIVEDEALIALELEEALAEAGYCVLATCASTAQAQAVLAQAPDIRVAILDVNLGGETSFDLAKALRERGTFVIFASGYETIDAPPELNDAPRLLKPMSREALATILATATGPPP